MIQTIRILSETEGPTLCLSFSGMISAHDFIEFHEKPLIEILKVHDHYNLYIVYEDDFEGWSEEAADLSFKLIALISPKARRAGYVNAPDSRRLLMKMVQPLTKLEVKYFEKEEAGEALLWVKGT